MEEIWKDIEGYEGKYFVSNTGKVKNNKGKLLKPRILKGYFNYSLSKNSKHKWFRVHRLVAKAFIPNPNNFMFINHKDENPGNNNVKNLEWCTTKYNNNYGTRLEKVSKTLGHKVLAINIITGEKLQFNSANKASKYFQKNGAFVYCYIKRNSIYNKQWKFSYISDK